MAAQVIGIARTAEQRFGWTRNCIGRPVRRSARDSQRDRWQRRCPSGLGQLIFPHDALVTVEMAFDSVLEDIGLFGQQAGHFELPSRAFALVSVRKEKDGLSNHKFAYR